MKYATLIEDVEQRAGAADSGEARRATEAVLAAFAGALGESVRGRLADVLPAQLRPPVARPAQSDVDGEATLVRAVAQQLDCAEERARYYTQAVLSTLREAEPGLAGEVARQVPWTRELMVPLAQGTAPRGSAVPTQHSPRLLDDEEIERALATMVGWTGDRHRLSRTVGLPADRIQPLLAAVHRAEEDLNHNATVEHDGDTITFHLWTHSLRRVTDLDLDLARRIDEAVDSLGSGG